ncbi:Protocadherin-18 [Manis pentadactyla]|nr:Protocadherin-18 [Manis pentadactyla]
MVDQGYCEKDLQEHRGFHLVIASDPDVGNGQIELQLYGSSCETFRVLVSVQHHEELSSGSDVMGIQDGGSEFEVWVTSMFKVTCQDLDQG